MEATQTATLEVGSNDIKPVGNQTTDNSVDLWGRPSKKHTTGGWKSVVFILAISTTDALSIFGTCGNLVTYLMFTLYLTESHSANTVTNFIGVNYLLPLFWGFIADSYLGRYLTISISSVVVLIGSVILAVQAGTPSLLPTRCASYPQCPEPSGSVTNMLFAGLFLVAVGSAGTKPCITSMGQDQFDVGDPVEKKNHPYFFTWFYTCSNVGTLIGFSFVVWIATDPGWKWAFGFLACGSLVGTAAFLMGTPFYRHQKTKGSSLTRLAQVLVVAVKNSKLPLPLDSSQLHELSDKDCALRQIRKVAHTNRLRCLDRAAIQQPDNTSAAEDGWNVCTVTQVEDVKAILSLLPIWMTNIAVYTLFANVMSFTIGQGNSMQRQVGNMIIPPASLGVFLILAAFGTVVIWQLVVEPLGKRRSPAGITHLERIGVGMVLAVMSMMAAGLVEHRRVSVIREHGLTYTDLVLGKVPMSVFYLLPQYFLLGATEFVLGVAQLGFFYDEVPEGMKSVGTSLYFTTVSMGYFLASILVTGVNRYTGSGHGGWLEAGGIEAGGLEKYYWLLFGIVGATALAFFALARNYTYKEVRSV